MIRSKPLRILLLYYVFLAISAVSFALLGIHKIPFTYGGGPAEFNPIWIPTIIGGMIALKLTVPERSFRIFVIVYTLLWILRFTFIYIGNRVGDIHAFGRLYHFNVIVNNYYRNVSRLDTHLPFVLFWFINFLFTKMTGPKDKKAETTASTPDTTISSPNNL